MEVKKDGGRGKASDRSNLVGARKPEREREEDREGPCIYITF